MPIPAIKSGVMARLQDQTAIGAAEAERIAQHAPQRIGRERRTMAHPKRRIDTLAVLRSRTHCWRSAAL
jgi:hypothetical protein